MQRYGTYTTNPTFKDDLNDEIIRLCTLSSYAMINDVHQLYNYILVYDAKKH